MTLNQMKDQLGLDAICELWYNLFEEIIDELPARMDALLNTERLAALMEENDILADHREAILRSARALRQNEAAALYLCLLEKTMEVNKLSAVNVRRILPGTEEGRYALIFPLLIHVPENVAYLRSRGMDEETIHDTMGEFDIVLRVHARRADGEYAVSSLYFGWLQHVYHNRHIRIGRLGFEMKPAFGRPVQVFRRADGEVCILAHNCRIHHSGRPLGAALCTEETDAFTAAVEENETAYIGHAADGMGLFSREKITLPKSEWTLALRPEDPVLSVHIPAGANLLPEDCEAAYAKARMLFPRCFPEFGFKAFACYSWMMDRQLQSLAKPGAGILSFQNKYRPFACAAGGTAVFNFVFQCHPEADTAKLDLTTLPENTSLRRAVKAHYLSGHRVYEDGGVFF